MEGSFIIRCVMQKTILQQHDFDGRFAMDYKDIKLHIGDIVTVTDDFGLTTLPTFVRKYGDEGFSIFGFEDYFQDSWINTDRIKDIQIIKKYYELETGYRVRGFVTEIEKYDLDSIIHKDKIGKKDLNKNVPIDFRIDMLQYDINNMLSANPTKEQAEKITKLNNEILFLKEKQTEDRENRFNR